MQNDKTSSLLNDLENLSIELDNLSSPIATSVDQTVQTEEAVERINESVNLDAMIADIVQSALPKLADQMTEQLRQQSTAAIRALYHESREQETQ